ncbi:Cj0814 family flagellar-dependent secreted protein [Campylobacter coli]
MINGINSYSSYNYTNTFSNNTSNTKSSNVINDNLNLVSDKSGAVNKVLGYGVDENGFFTSDFNEAAGLPKDYKIYAKSAESFVNFQENDNYLFSFFHKVDIAKTIGNSYKILSQIIPKTSNAYLSPEELKNIPYAINIDENSKVTKTYTYEEFKEYKNKEINSKNYPGLTFNTTTGLIGINYEYLPIDTNNIFNSDNSKAQIDKTPYIDNNGNVSKGGVLMAFLNQFGTSKIEGDTKLIGKLIGYDNNIDNSQIDFFQNFMNINKIQSAFLSSSNPNEWNPFEERLSMKLFIRRSDNIGNTELSRLAMDLDKEYQEMINSNMSLEEFKTKYLDFKQRHDEFVEKLKEAEKAKGIDYDIYPTGKPIDDTKAIEEAQKNKRKPIQAESKSETYKEDNTRNELLRKLLETKFGKSDELEILFGMKFKGDIGEFNKILSLNSAPKSVDIKA